MTKIYTGASMSLDGYVAGPNETGFEHLFAWYDNGDVEIPTAKPDMTFRMSETSARHWRELIETSGAIVVGRRLFEITSGWGGNHPIGLPVVVLSHRPAPEDFVDGNKQFTFVDTFDEAIEAAKRLAGDKGVGLNAGTVARQALNAGILDEVWIDLVPVVLGGGTPFFDSETNGPALLEGPYQALQGDKVTHLRYRVVKNT
jgi:dihydrofolate reductase